MTGEPTIVGERPKIRVLIADDHVTVREGLAAIIGRQADMVVVAEAATGRDAITLWRDHRHDVTLMDLRMPVLDGVGAMVGICELDAAARIVVLATFDSDRDISRAIEAGAKGYPLKDAQRDELLGCIRSVRAGVRVGDPLTIRLLSCVDPWCIERFQLVLGARPWYFCGQEAHRRSLTARTDIEVKITPALLLVGHDWGAAHAWNAALMRPDRFNAVFCMSVPYVPRGDVSVFERMRKSGHQNDFYMFEQMKPEADQMWADASVTIPGILYWASGSAPADTRWNPMDPARSLHRPAPGPLPSWAEADYVTHNIAEFQRTGFHGGLNYYRAAEPYFYLSGAWKAARITQPSFYIAGKADGLGALYPPFEQLRAGLPGLVGNLEIDNVGHWVQHEASAEVSDQLVKFLRTVNPA